MSGLSIETRLGLSVVTSLGGLDSGLRIESVEGQCLTEVAAESEAQLLMEEGEPNQVCQRIVAVHRQRSSIYMEQCPTI
jgi:hypothetical protein